MAFVGARGERILQKPLLAVRGRAPVQPRATDGESWGDVGLAAHDEG